MGYPLEEAERCSKQVVWMAGILSRVSNTVFQDATEIIFSLRHKESVNEDT